ncbi:MAG: 50S ribosomal protein L32 [Candidatus Omnitrophica bacterium]|nr:50S ribosomal protein L32 [Candidatus Omnitrophota bacterium]
MPLPKRRHSSTRQAKRRTHVKVNKPSLSLCPSCKLPALPHRVCPHCGQYKGRQVIRVDKQKKGEKGKP